MDTEQRAAHARQLKDDPLLREVLDGLRNAAIEAWARTKTDDAQQREFSWLMVKALDAIEGNLQAVIDDQFLSAQASVRAPR